MSTFTIPRDEHAERALALVGEAQLRAEFGFLTMPPTMRTFVAAIASELAWQSESRHRWMAACQHGPTPAAGVEQLRAFDLETRP